MLSLLPAVAVATLLAGGPQLAVFQLWGFSAFRFIRR